MRFLSSAQGYVLVLTLLFMPVFIGVAVLVIDLGRGNNAHSDLQAAADALALAGARELDGGTTSIDRAKLAMAELSNSVSFLRNTADENQITLVYADEADNEFNVIFLDAIPDEDTSPIDQAWVDAHGVADEDDDSAAAFVYVAAQSLDYRSLFSSALTGLSRDVPVAAVAVATSRSAACDVTPLFICNPFEAMPEGADLQASFAAGELHGRLVQLHNKANATDFAGPGNFGYLQTNGSSSANAIREYFAGDYNPTCYNAGTVETKPGYATSIATGFNVRFDIWDGPFRNRRDEYVPAFNVRKGYDEPNGNAVCTQQSLGAVADGYMGFPGNDTMAAPTNGAGGVLIGTDSDWDLPGYWDVNHPTRADLDPNTDYPLISSFEDLMPSRYDIYRYEIEKHFEDEATELVADLSTAANRRESGLPQCWNRSNVEDPPDPEDGVALRDRRVIFAAVINCLENPFNGQSTLPVEAFASIFLVSPMEKPSNNGKNNTAEDENLSEGGVINAEIIDITGWGGNGSLDAFIRTEAFLVR